MGMVELRARKQIEEAVRQRGMWLIVQRCATANRLPHTHIVSTQAGESLSAAHVPKRRKTKTTLRATRASTSWTSATTN